MTQFTVQFTLPCENPEMNVSITKKSGTCSFQVPINHPKAHIMGFQDLLAAAQLSGLFTVSPTLNKTERKEKKVQ